MCKGCLRNVIYNIMVDLSIIKLLKWLPFCCSHLKKIEYYTFFLETNSYLKRKCLHLFNLFQF